jgi:hypothetical protein
MYHRELSDFINHVREGGVGCARETEIIDVLTILEQIK